MDFSILYLIAGCDGCHAWGRRRLLNLEHLVVFMAGQSHQHSVHGLCRKFPSFTGFVYYLFTPFSGCRASFVCSRYSILECGNLLSGVKLSIRLLCFIISTLFIPGESTNRFQYHKHLFSFVSKKPLILQFPAVAIYFKCRRLIQSEILNILLDKKTR